MDEPWQMLADEGEDFRLNRLHQSVCIASGVHDRSRTTRLTGEVAVFVVGHAQGCVHLACLDHEGEGAKVILVGSVVESSDKIALILELLGFTPLVLGHGVVHDKTLGLGVLGEDGCCQSGYSVFSHLPENLDDIRIRPHLGGEVALEGPNYVIEGFGGPLEFVDRPSESLGKHLRSASRNYLTFDNLLEGNKSAFVNSHSLVLGFTEFLEGSNLRHVLAGARDNVRVDGGKDLKIWTFDAVVVLHLDHVVWAKVEWLDWSF